MLIKGSESGWWLKTVSTLLHAPSSPLPAMLFQAHKLTNLWEGVGGLERIWVLSYKPSQYILVLQYSWDVTLSRLLIHSELVSSISWRVVWGLNGVKHKGFCTEYGVQWVCRKCRGCLWFEVPECWFSRLQDGDDRAIFMWVSRRILGNHSLLVGCCGSSLRNSFLWFPGVPSSTAPETGNFPGFLVSYSCPGWQGHVSWFWLCGFHWVVPTQSLRSSYQLFGDVDRHQSKNPLPEGPYSGLGVLFVEFAFASWHTAGLSDCRRTHPSSSPPLLCVVLLFFLT